MKKLLFITFLILLLSSCNYINENKIENETNISIENFLDKDLENEIEDLEKIEIKLDDFITNWSWSEIDEEDINELIELLFD